MARRAPSGLPAEDDYIAVMQHSGIRVTRQSPVFPKAPISLFFNPDGAYAGRADPRCLATLSSEIWEAV